MNIAPLTLYELNRRVSDAIASAPGLSNVWIVAETSDLRSTGGHCYLELIDKDPETGSARARARATIWASRFARLNADFRAATGSPLSSNIKVMVQASVTYHPVYGLSLNITDVNAEYTLGDLLRRRREMLARLQAEGILNCNRELEWPAVPWRIAVISAAGAAGYGDFINQLYTNAACLRFRTRLYEARMQGEDTAPSIISALERIAAADEEYDCVVIIRGGGATGDLASFDNYELAANIAMFPLPVVVGIGHERDVTLLDYVANMRVKTPTAAAEWLIGRGMAMLDRLRTIGSGILDAATTRINMYHRRIEYITGQLPAVVRGVTERAGMRVGPMAEQAMAQSVENLLRRRADRLEALGAIVDTLSPEATLRRGFSITRVDGHAVTDVATVSPGATLTTTLATGMISSTVRECQDLNSSTL